MALAKIREADRDNEERFEPFAEGDEKRLHTYVFRLEK